MCEITNKSYTTLYYNIVVWVGRISIKKVLIVKNQKGFHKDNIVNMEEQRQGKLKSKSPHL